MLGKGRQRLWTELFCRLCGWGADGAVAVEEQNPDDAATENTGSGVTTPLACICHAQLENLVEETASSTSSLALPCNYNFNCLKLGL